MPSTGMPRSKIAGSHFGALAWYTLAFRGVGLVYARRAAAQDDARGRRGADLLRRSFPGDDLTVDMKLADAPCDELTVLGSEIQHENSFRMIHDVSSHVV